VPDGEEAASLSVIGSSTPPSHRHQTESPTARKVATLRPAERAIERLRCSGDSISNASSAISSEGT